MYHNAVQEFLSDDELLVKPTIALDKAAADLRAATLSLSRVDAGHCFVLLWHHAVPGCPMQLF